MRYLPLVSLFLILSLQGLDYVDVSLSSPVSPEALDEFNEVSKLNGNSSGLNSHSKRLKQIEEESLNIIARKIGCDPKQIVFTSSATMSNNLAILGVAYKYPGCHLITSKIERKNVMNIFKYLEGAGFSVTYIDVDQDGNLDLKQLEESFRPETRLVSIQAFNRETETPLDLEAISKVVKAHEKVLFHSDISQCVGKHPIDFSVMDLVTFTGSRVGVPKGIAALYIKDSSQINPVLFGTGDKFFPGSKPTALISAFAKTIGSSKINLSKQEEKKVESSKTDSLSYISVADNYLDYAASAPINNESLNKFNAISKLEKEALSKNLKQIVEESSKTISHRLGCEPNQIVFTSSATMSNNLAILGVAFKNPGCHLITSKIEHKSVLNVFKHLETLGYKVTYIDVDRYGNLNLKQFKESIKPETRFVSIQAFNSEIGTRQNMEEIAKIIRKHENIMFHSDISQSFGKYPLDISILDLATFCGYKIGSPKGIAALYIKDSSKIAPVFFGPGNKFFPGSAPLALFSAFAKTVETYKFDLNVIEKNFESLKQEISNISDVYINSEKPSHVFSVSIKGVLLRDVIDRLKKFSFSSGCSCLGQGGESNVKEAIDPEGKLPSTTLRISFSDKVPEKNLIDFAKTLKTEVEKLREEKSVSDNCEKNDDQKALSNALLNLTQ